MEHSLRPWYILLAISAVGATATALSVSAGTALLAIAAYLFARFVHGLVKGRFGVDLLMGVAAFVTWYLGAYFEGFLIMGLYSISEIVEGLAEKRAFSALSSLKELIPRHVVVVRNGLKPVRPEDVRVGDVVLVRRGEAVVVDGVLLDDVGVFDTSIMTGEQEPVKVVRGEAVLSGFVNVGDPVRVRATKGFGDSALRLLVNEAFRALERKTRIQRLLETITPPYTAVLLGSYVIASLIMGPYQALPVILAGCPSAFIVTSAALTASAIARLAGEGVVVRGGVVLERAWGVVVVVLDKTGTVTTGGMEVASVRALNGFNEGTVLALAGAAAKGSTHPASEALSTRSELVPASVREYVGAGVEATVNGRVVRIGNSEFVGFGDSFCDGLTPVHVSVDGVPAGVVCLKEYVADDVKELVQWLRSSGIEVVMASGDREEKVSTVAEEIGVGEYYSSMGPGEKAGLVRKLRRTYGRVAVIGDGINDAIALAEADLGMAVGRLGLTASVADAVLLSGPAAAAKLLSEARRYRTALVAGFITAAAIKAASLILGLVGAVPIAAVVALGDDGATIISLMVSWAVTDLIPYKQRGPHRASQASLRSFGVPNSAPNREHACERYLGNNFHDSKPLKLGIRVPSILMPE